MEVQRTPEEMANIPDEQRLMNHIMRGYEKAVRPVRNATTAVIIRMGLTLTQIFDMVSVFESTGGSFMSVIIICELAVC